VGAVFSVSGLGEIEHNSVFTCNVKGYLKAMKYRSGCIQMNEMMIDPVIDVIGTDQLS
jgi:hypothetical protein